MSIFKIPFKIQFVFFFFLLCPVAPQTGHTVKQVTSGQCTSTDLIQSAADCRAAGMLFGFCKTITYPGCVESGFWTKNSGGAPPGCGYGWNELNFNLNNGSTAVCGDGVQTGWICLCVDTCPIGKYQSELASHTCKICPAGTYNDEAGRALCKECTRGRYSYTSETGQTTITCKGVECSAGTFSSEIGIVTPPKCKSCRAGTFDNKIGRMSCKGKCPIGTFSSEIGQTTAATCVKCTGGQYSSETSIAQCKGRCPNGKYSSEIGQTKNRTCTSCLPGFYNTINTGRSSCTECPSGWFQFAVGSSKQNDCKSCNFGKYAPSSSTLCTECAAGFYQAKELATTWNCSSCSVGMFTPDKRTPCVHCEKGRYQSRQILNVYTNTVCDICTSGRAPNAIQSECNLEAVIFVAPLFVIAIFIAVSILIWYQYKVEDQETEEYETFFKFYSSRYCPCCLQQHYQRRESNIQMAENLLSIAEQDPLTLAQWKIPSDQLTLGERIGQGGCGWVYEGTYGGSSASVPIACKEVMSATIDPDDLQEFEHEARMMTQLHHPHVLKFYGICSKTVNNEQTCGHDEKRMYMVTELAPGGSLEGRLQEAELQQINSPDMELLFDNIQMVKWAVQIAAGMSHIHSRGFIHRDIKPQNVLLNKSNDALICDLGTVKNLTPGAYHFDRRKTSEYREAERIGLLAAAKFNSDNGYDQEAPMMTKDLGTPLYMAPESYSNQSYTNAVDVWAYGVLLIRLFTLSCPFRKNVTRQQLIDLVPKNKLRPNEVESKDLPHRNIKEIIDGCLEYHASERFTFGQIEKRMFNILKEMEETEEKTKELRKYLNENNLIELIDKLIEEGVECKQDLIHLTAEDLKSYGLNTIKARKAKEAFNKICGGGENKSER